MVIAIDAGHGGKDSGAVGPTGLKESVVNLAVANLVERKLKLYAQQVVQTRRNNTKVSLGTRCRYANDAGAKAFVSIHCNWFKDPEVGGFEVWHYADSTRGKALAQQILGGLQISMMGMRNRGLKETRGLYVLKHTRMPACLVELGFLSNPAEERMLRDPVAQGRFAEAIEWGIVLWLDLV